MKMFWGLILKANKKYTQILEKPFHLTKAALDYSNADNGPVQVMYSDGRATYLLCTLQKDKELQCALDLSFNEGDKLCFSILGNGIVHLTGYLIPEDDLNYDPEMDDGESEDLSAEEEDLDADDLRLKLMKNKKEKEKGKLDKKEKGKKKAPVEPESSEEESEQSDEDEQVQNGNKSLDSSAMGEEESEEDDDDDEGVEDEEESGEEDDDEEGSDSGEDESDEEEEEVKAPPKKQAKLDPQLAKKQQQKNGLENGQQKKNKKDKSAQQDQQQAKKQNQADNAVKKLQGGLTYQDLKVGSGAEVKPGKKIQVYYEGRIKSNNKVFDSTKSGPGFKLTVGRGEVIKAWDLGLTGMKVGGKRRLTCPPGLAYGAKGNPPVIPPNSTLVFDVELKNVL